MLSIPVFWSPVSYLTSLQPIHSLLLNVSLITYWQRHFDALYIAEDLTFTFFSLNARELPADTFVGLGIAIAGLLKAETR